MKILKKNEVSMKRFTVSLIFITILVLILTSCYPNLTKDINNNLNDDLYELYETKPVNMQVSSKCSSPPLINIINKEVRKENYTVLERGINAIYITPNELIDHVVDYMKDAFERCNIKVDNKSTKVINVYMEKADFTQGVWAQGAEFQLKIEIPEKSYNAIFGSKDNAYADMSRAMAYAIHTTIWKVIADQYVQDYILCK